MNNTMSSTHEQSIKYLDYILNEEEKRQNDSYSHQWRNFTISRSGRFKTKNKHRDSLFYGKLFDQQSFNHVNTNTNTNTNTNSNANANAIANTNTTINKNAFGNGGHANGYKNVSDKDMTTIMKSSVHNGCKHTDV